MWKVNWIYDFFILFWKVFSFYFSLFPISFFFKFFSKIFIWQAANALLIIRYIAVFLAQRLSPTEFTNIFGNRGSLYQSAHSEIHGREIDEDEDVEEDNSKSSNHYFYHLNFL